MARKMRDTGVEWIGEVPEGWEIVPSGCFFSEVKEKNVEGMFKKQLSFKYGEIVDKTGNEATKEAEEEVATAYRIVTPDTIMINGLNLNYDLISQRVAIVKETGIITSAYLAVKGSEKMFPKFSVYLFKGYDSKQVFHSYGSGIRKTLKYSDFKDIPSIVPPLPEQRRIADYLDEKCAAIDGAVGELKRGIEDCKAWKKAIIFEAVTGKANVLAAKNAKVAKRQMRDSGIPWIGEIPEGWRVMRLKHLIGILPGYAFKSEDFNFSNGIRLLRGINVGVDSLRWDECVYWDRVISEDLDRYQIQAGDLIVGLDRPWIEEGTRVCFAKKEDLPCLLVQRVCRIRTLGEMDLRIINYWLSSEAFERALACDTTGVSVPHISPYQIMEFRITLPSLSEQRAIADHLDEKCAAIDALVAEKEKLITDLEAYKKSLIFELVTGKREVA